MTDVLTRHRFERPPDLDMPVPPRHRVVIVGAGSVGLTLALALARHGVRSVVLERTDTVGAGSRALGMSRRTMEIWEALGVAEPIMDIGIPWSGGRSFHRGRTIVEFSMPVDPLVRHAPMRNIAQCTVDEILVAAIERTGMVDLRWLTGLEGLEPVQGTDGRRAAALSVVTPLGPYTLEAEHVVACDGGRSTVRSLMGLRLEGTTFDSNYVIVDVALESDHPAERRAWFDPPSNPGSTVLMHRQPGGVWRLDYQLRPGEDPAAALDPAAVEARVADHLAMIGERPGWTIRWISSYRANSACLADFRHGPVLFAGDAAHLIPIFGIRGLNSGVEDAWTLAWKLASTVEGTADSTLLESYSIERVAAARENMAAANRSTRVMTPDTPGLRLLRDAVLALAVDEPAVQDVLNPRQGAPAAAHGSPLNTPEEPDSFAAGPRPGEGLPDIAIELAHPGGERSTTHLLGLLDPTAFTLLVVGELEPALSDLIQSDLIQSDLVRSAPALRLVHAVERPGSSTQGQVIDDGRLATRLDAHGGAVYLVRPDHLVCARWRRPQPAQVAEALERARGLTRDPTMEPLEPASVSPPAPVAPVAPVERIYQMLADAVDQVGEGSTEHFLAKLALLAGLHIADETALQQMIDVSLRQPDASSGPTPSQEGQTP